MPEIYVSTDVEADGPIPGPHSMLSFGSAAYQPDGTLHDTFTATLQPLPEATADPATASWWQQHPEALAAATLDPQPPQEVIPQYVAWLDQLPGRAVFVGYPAAYDFMFVYWYLIRFAGRSPFSHSALDIKTYAMSLLGTEYRASTKRRMPKEWFGPQRHNHHALDDAIEQGALFCTMLSSHRA